MIKIDMQFFGGRGSASGVDDRNEPTIVNTVGASEKSVSIMEKARQALKETSVARIEINSTEKVALSPKAENPSDKKLEKEIQKLAEVNEYEVEFSTTTKTSAYGKSTTMLRERVGENKIQIKKRFVTVRKRTNV